MVFNDGQLVWGLSSIVLNSGFPTSLTRGLRFVRINGGELQAKETLRYPDRINQCVFEGGNSAQLGLPSSMIFYVQVESVGCSKLVR